MKHKALMAPSSGGEQNMSFDSGDENVTTSPRSHEIAIAVDFKDTGNFTDIFYYFISYDFDSYSNYACFLEASNCRAFKLFCQSLLGDYRRFMNFFWKSIIRHLSSANLDL